MMRFDIVTLFPEMFQAITEYGVTGRAVTNKQLELAFWNPRDYTQDARQTVDDRPYGGGPGMVMKVEPLLAAIAAAKAACAKPCRVIMLSPQGQCITQQDLAEMSQGPRPILIAGRYEGVDERIYSLAVDEEWSIGDYVLTGGELAAMVMIDAAARFIPGVLGDENSALQDSFMEGLLDFPQYTRPENLQGLCVPDVLLSGNHQAISAWRRRQQIERTLEKRPDLLCHTPLNETEQALLNHLILEKET